MKYFFKKPIFNKPAETIAHPAVPSLRGTVGCVLIYILACVCLAWLIFTFLYQYIAAIGYFKEVLHALVSERILSAFWLSISSAIITVIVSLPLGIAAAYIFATKEFRGKHIIETLSVDVPQTFPPVTEGMIYLLMLGPDSPFHIDLAYTFTALVIAKVYVCMPFIIYATKRKFQEIHETGMNMTAMALGAHPFQIFTMIFLPLAARDIIASSALCWARAMGELGGSLIFAGVIPYKTEIIPNFIAMQASTLTVGALAATILATTTSALALLFCKRLT